MVKICSPVNDTWIISNETLLGIKDNSTYIYPIWKPRHISKFIQAFRNVYSHLRLGYCHGSPTEQPAFLFTLYIFASNTTADICISIKNTNYKIYFKNVSSCSDSFRLPSFMLNPTRYPFMIGRFEIEINGMFYMEKDEYPTIPRMIDLDEKLWKNKEKDFDIIVINGRKNEKKIQIHKKVLMAQSPAFEGMLNSGMEEAQTNTLKIIDFNSDTIKLAVEFFYGNNLLNSTSFEDIFELYRFADKYFIDNLMDYITTFFSYRLKLSNINKIYDLSNAFNHIKLQDACNQFLNASTENADIGIYTVYNKN